MKLRACLSVAALLSAVPAVAQSEKLHPYLDRKHMFWVGAYYQEAEAEIRETVDPLPKIAVNLGHLGVDDTDTTWYLEYRGRLWDRWGIVASAQNNCFFAPFGDGVVTLTADHNNVLTDDTCFAGASDLVVADAGLGSLADNGGPTLTHALLAGSPAIDAADAAVCPATDQRGVTRPQGAGCDVGAYEVEP